MILCPHENGTGALLFLGEGNRNTTVIRKRNWCSTVLRIRDLVLYCSQEKETGALLFLGERNRCSTVLREENRDTIVIRRRKLVLYCSQVEGNWCYTAYVFRKRGLVFYSFQEKGTGALSITVLRIGEGNRCSTVFRRRKQVLYCF